jgi:hypothetical protein
MTYLGLDLGTGFAKLARLRVGDGASGDDLAVSAVLTALTYQGRYRTEIPSSYPAEPMPGSVRCDGFPAVLGSPAADRQVTAWGDRTAGEVTRGYLRCLLDAAPQSGDPSPDGDDLVVAVPAVGTEADGYLPSAGAELRDSLTALGCPPRRLIPAPVAALLWLRHRDPGCLADVGKVAVIDVGAGSVDLTLCTVAGYSVRVTDATRLAGPAPWGEIAPTADGAGRPTALAERLVMALAAVGGDQVDQGSSWHTAFLWRAFEDALADVPARERLDVVLQMAAEAPGRHGATTALRFAGIEVTAAQVIDACEPLARHAVAALGELLGRQDAPGWMGFGAAPDERVLLLGGLTALRPVRAALLESLGLDPDHPSRTLLSVPGDDSRTAVARGAALLAAGLADPGDRYPHALQLEVHRSVYGSTVAEFLELAPSGTIDLEVPATVYLSRTYPSGDDEPVRIVVRPSGGGSAAAMPPVPVRIVRASGDPVRALFHPTTPPPPGTYHVGVRGGPGGPVVLLQPIGAGVTLAYRLIEPAETIPDGQSRQETR